MITVVGGTGRLGRVVCASLMMRDLPVRVASRHAGSAASDPHLAGAELVEADVADPRQARAVISGSSHVVAAMTGMDPRGGAGPKAVDRDAAIVLIDAAADVGCHLVLVSVVGAAPDSPIELFRMKAAAEQRLKGSRMAWTMVRPTAYQETWLEIVGRPLVTTGSTRVFGRGQNPINFVSADDVAALVDLVVGDPATRGQTLDIGGPDNLTFGQLAAALLEAGGVRGPPRHVPPFVLHVVADTICRLKPQLGRQIRAALAMDRLDQSFDSTAIHRRFPQLPTTSVADLLGVHC